MDHLKVSWVLRAGMLGLAMACIFGACRAQTDPVIEAASAALRSERPQTAWDLLEPLEPQRSGERDFDLLLGMAAMAAGHPDRAIVAFERVLITDPSYAGARIELGRAYLGLGALDLSRAEFTAALELEPPAPARRALERFLADLERREREATTRTMGWIETGTGFDSNLSAATRDFQGAILSGFGVPDVTPTGNSVLRRASFVTLTAGFDHSRPLGRGLTFYSGAELRRRAYERFGAFDVRAVDVRAGVQTKVGGGELRTGLNWSAFRQKGMAPAEPPASSDREVWSGVVDYRHPLTDTLVASSGLQAGASSFPDSPTQDVSQAAAQVALARLFPQYRDAYLGASLGWSRDAARRVLPTGSDVSRTASSIRLTGQWPLHPAFDLQGGLGWALRRDLSDFARSTQIPRGRDLTSDLSAGLVWRPAAAWSVRASMSYVVNASTIDLYDFRRWEGSIVLRRSFGG